MHNDTCGYCGESVSEIQLVQHAMHCRDLHSAVRDIMPDDPRDSVFDYLDMPCGGYIKRWTFTEHMSGCVECAEIFTREMYGNHSSTREMM